MWRLNREITLVIVTLILVGCGGTLTSDSSLDNTQSLLTQSTDENSFSEADTSTANKGYYLDSEVKGVTYECGEFRGVTSGDGLFLFQEKQDCTFKLGDIPFKTIEKDRLFNGVTVIEDDINTARVLQTMDIDNNPTNGIDIEPEAIDCLNGKMPKSEDEFDQLVECLNSADVPDFVHRDYAVTEDEARDHIEETKKSLVPVAKDLTVQTSQDDGVEINIMAENPRSDILTYQIVEAPKNGKLIGKAPDLIYVPNEGFIGVDNFSYVASNTRFSSNIATVSINVVVKKFTLSEKEKITKDDMEDEKMYVDVSDEVLIYNSSTISSSKDLTRDEIIEITKDVYSQFKDNFDFIFIVSNSEDRDSCRYSGLYFGVKNDTNNLGNERFDYTSHYGSAGRLQGVIHFPSIEKLESGPKLHELLHRWANHIIDVTINGEVTHHWGYNGFDKKGQLGGFEISTLKVESGTLDNGGLFSAESFGSNANGGDSIPYNKIELYLMGLIPADEVGDIMLSYNAKYVRSDEGRVYFKADKIEKISFENYLHMIGVPKRVENGRKSYRILTVLLTNFTPSRETLDRVNGAMDEFARDTKDQNDRVYNFFEATNGKMRLEIDNLSDSLR